MRPKYFNGTSVYPLILLLIGSGLLALSWQKWSDIIVDFGRELYVPWRITQGQVLYRDIAFLFGPLSPYWNALLFKLWGARMMTLVFFNIFLVAVMTAVVYRTMVILSHRTAAFMAGIAFLLLFAFGQYSPTSTHNYICPYSYSATYAVSLALGAMHLFVMYGGRPRQTRLPFWTGLLLGLCALARLEIFLAVTPALAVGFAAKGRMDGWGLGKFLRTGSALAAGCCLPIAAAFCWFSTQMPLNKTLAMSIAGYNPHWRDVSSLYLYRAKFGLGGTYGNMRYLFLAAGVYVWAVEALALLCSGRNTARVLGLSMVLAVMWLILSDHYLDIFRGLPLLMIFMAGSLLAGLVSNAPSERKDSRLPGLLAMVILALLLLFKIFLAATVTGYGFIYALPSVLMFIVFFMGWVPDQLGRLFGRGDFIRAVSMALLLCIFAVYAVNNFKSYASRNICVPEGERTKMCFDATDKGKAAGTSAFLDHVDRIMAPNENFVVFPEGAMLNFLSRRPDPLRHVTFMPAEMAAFGEAEFLHAFMEGRPDYVVFVSRPLKEYGLEGVGKDYANTVVAWIRAHYEPVWHAGGGVFEGNEFGLEVLKRR